MNYLHIYNKLIRTCKKACRAAVATGLVAVMSFLLAACAATVSGNKKGGITPGSAILPIASKAQLESEPASGVNGEISLTGVLTYIDKAEGKMHYMDISSGYEYEVSYNGGTDIRNRYDTIITTNKMKMSGIYDVSCSSSGMALTIYESGKAWEISKITGFVADEREQVATLSSQTYKYSKAAVVLSDSDRIRADEIMKQDEVTVYGMDKTIYGVRVDRGHGYLKLTGIDDFIGGYVDIGTEYVYVISKDMLITVPEGEYKVSVQNMSRTLSGSKSVRIEKDRDVSLDFGEYHTNAVQNGLVEFSVTPSGAVMYIDGTQVNYSEPISLDYGRHTVVLRANNYLAYEEVFFVKQSYEKKIIDMNISQTSSRAQSTSRASQTRESSAARTSKAASSAAGSRSSSKSNEIINGTVKNLTEGYYVNIKEPHGAAVYVNSSYVGMAPVAVEKSAGTMVITLTMAGYQTKSYSIDIPNSTGDLNYSFPDLALSSGTASTQLPKNSE